MTREKAIQMLEYIRYTGNGESDYKNDAQSIALDMAIKALEQQPCEDCISRQAVLDKKELIKLDDGQSFYCISPEDVETLPPVQPKYNTSEWCHDCKEYDHDKHCCPRYNKVIRNAVEEMKQPKTGRWKKMVSVYDVIEGKYTMIPYTRKDEELNNTPIYICDCGSISKKPTNYCSDCGTKMIDVPDINDGKLSEIPTSSESEE